MNNLNYLPPFKRFCVTIGNLPSSYVESMSYYECLMWLCKYLKDTVVPAVNENAEAVNELINWFNNLDVQDEIDHKLDEMVESGQLQEMLQDALANLESDLYTAIENTKNELNTSIANTESVLDTQFINASNYATLDMTGQNVVQSFCYDTDNNKTYVAFLNNNTVTIKRFNGYDFTTSEAQLVLPISCHANSMVYYNGKLYIANYNTNTNVDIVDCSTFAYVRSISMGTAIRSFEIFKKENHVYIAMQGYNDLKISYYVLMPNNKFVYMCTQPTNLYYGPKNAVRLINYNGNDFMVFCNASSNRSINNEKGNILEWYIPFNTEQPPINLGILNVNEPIEDIITLSTNNYLLLGEYGHIYQIAPKITSWSYPWLYNSSRSYNNTSIYLGKDTLTGDSGYEYETFNTGSNTTCKMIKSFLLPMFPYTLAVTFIKQHGNVYDRHTENIVSTSPYTGGISLPIFNIIRDADGNKHLFKGSIVYYGSTININGTQWWKYTITHCQVDELIWDSNGALTSFINYNSLSNLKTYLDTNNLGLAIGNVNIDNIKTNGNFIHIPWETSEVNWL